MDGITAVYKEKGYTSFDVVAVLRGILKEKKIGHTGTLDPDAEGVLVVCCGTATKLIPLMEDTDKTYEAVLRLGVETDTQDMTGKILRESPVVCGAEEILEAVRSFEGDILQIPPMYSAVKVGGKKLYELARAGRSVERKPREVTIRRIRILSEDIPRIRMEVCCSKGTYIRTLCHDIGQRLGCGGAMESLLRTKACGYTLKDALRLDEISRRMAAGDASFLHPVESFFAGLRPLRCGRGEDSLLRNGNPIPLPPGVADGQRLRMYLSDGTFAGVYEADGAGGRIKPWKMLLRNGEQ